MTFTYEAGGVQNSLTGRVASFTTREGGVISYQYPPACNLTGNSSNTLTRSTQDGTTTYSKIFNGTQFVTTVIDPGQNKTVYYLAGTFLTEKDVYQNTGTVSSPSYTLLSKAIYCYNANQANCTTASVQYPITQRDTYTTIGGMTSSSHVTETFDTYGNITSTIIFGPGFGSTSAYRTTTITYGSCGAGPTVHDKPCEIKTVEGASPNTVADIQNTYSSQGFRLSSKQWTGLTWLTTTATPNPNGTVATSTDINQQQTSYSYDGPGGCNSLLLTGTSTTVNSVTLTTGTTWDCNAGLVLSTTGANSDKTQYAYDEMLRQTSVTDPTTFTVNESFPTVTTSTSSWSMTGASSSTTTTVDGLGRPILTQTTAGTQYNTTSTSYGFSGAPWRVSPSYPCLQSQGAPCTNSDYLTFDPLSRPIVELDGTSDGELTYTYVQNDVQSTLHSLGENNKVAQTEYDALGRETSTCGIVSSGGTLCGQAMGGSGILTTNTYSSGPGSSTIVSARGVQTRTTVKDALGRVISMTTPEQGTVTYLYDSDNTGDNCGNNRGNLNGRLAKINYADGSYNCFDYGDGTSRVTDIGNSNQSTTNPAKRFRYDATSNAYVANLPSGYTATNIRGRLMEAETDNAGVTLTDEWFAYDADGRVTDVWESTLHSGGYYHTTADYYPNGQLHTLSGIPGYSTYTVSLDSNGRPLSSALGSLTIVNTLTRDGANRPLTIKFGNGSNYDTYSYLSNGLMASYSFVAGSLTDSGTLTWNINDTLHSLAITDGFNSADTQTCTFSYDDIGRLLTDNCGSTVWNQTYSYDQYDNLTKTGNPGTTWNPGYNASNNQVTGASYDGRGDVTYDLNNTYTWDLYGKVHSAAAGKGTATCGSVYHCYTYDALGRLVETSSQTTYSEVLYSPLGRTAIMSGATTVSNAILPNPGGGSTYFSGSGGSGQRGINHLDWLGSPRLQTALNSTNAFMDTAYTPYGEMYATSGTSNSPPRQMFTGDFTDTYSASLYDTPNREFDFGSGSRWLSPDPAEAGWNLYAYGTNPNSDTDRTGLSDGDLAGYGGEFGDGWWQDTGFLGADSPNPAAKCDGWLCWLKSLFGGGDTDPNTLPPNKPGPKEKDPLGYGWDLDSSCSPCTRYDGERYSGADRFHYGPTYLRIMTERMMGVKAADSQGARLATGFLIMGGGAETEGLGAIEQESGGVYLLRDAEGRVMRTGRTASLARRATEHARDPILKDYTFEIVYRTDSYPVQRGLEQMLHDLYSPPLNKINPINPLNPNRSFYYSAAEEFLQNFLKGTQ